MELGKIRNGITLVLVYGEGTKSSFRCRVVQKNPPSFWGLVEIVGLQGAFRGEFALVTPEQLRPVLFRLS